MKKQSSIVPIAAVAAILLVVHQDYWLWSNKTLIFGFLPIGLFWHLGISLAAVTTWFLVTQFYWPFEHEDIDSNSMTNNDSHRSSSEEARG